jgi:hypothetical protein
MLLCDQRHVTAAYPPEIETALCEQEAGWILGPVWTGAENLAPNTDSIPRTSRP